MSFAWESAADCTSHVKLLLACAGTQQVQKAMKGGEGGGIYFPIIAAQVSSQRCRVAN